MFVFDGAPPQLKRETLARRRMKRSKESRVARDASEKILSNYLQRQAVAQKLNRQTHAVENALKQGAKVSVLEMLLNCNSYQTTTGVTQADQRTVREGEGFI